MESPYYAPPRMDASRPSLGFPLGTALLLIVIFSLSGIFSCCYHWEKLRSIRRSLANDADLESGGSPSKPKLVNMGIKQNQSQSLPVLMPGDKMPKFMALPCPRQPPPPEKFTVVVHQPPKPPPIAVPLY